MKFEEVLQALRDGKKVKRPDWCSVWLLIHCGCIYYFDKQLDDYIEVDDAAYSLASEDLLAEDWEIVE